MQLICRLNIANTYSVHFREKKCGHEITTEMRTTMEYIGRKRNICSNTDDKLLPRFRKSYKRFSERKMEKKKLAKITLLFLVTRKIERRKNNITAVTHLSVTFLRRFYELGVRERGELFNGIKRWFFSW